MHNLKPDFQYEHSYHDFSTRSYPTSTLEQRYKELQEEKFQKQLQTQNKALLQQQQTFALRQQLNPPVPTYTPQSPLSYLNSLGSNLQKCIPPTTLDLNLLGAASSHPQQDSQMYHAYNDLLNKPIHEDNIPLNVHQPFLQQKSNFHELKSPQSQVIIQQNHPSLVVNQACQTQMSDPSVKSSSSTSVTPQTPPHHHFEKRKQESTQLKSPTGKRNPSATVTKLGWLYKQGTDGLKVWRKRWFVLSEFCLFYYKGSDESKLLGSILLPSYNISFCDPEDKIYRKFAFKCEHINMRTYCLAAESQESMRQWVKCLTAASLMQSFSESDSHPSSPTVSQSIEGTDSGINTCIVQSRKTLTPASKFNGQPVCHLYVNAPPKPKRLGPDDVCSLPSPDRIQDIYESRKSSICGTMDLEPQLNEVKFPDSTQNTHRKGFDSKNSRSVQNSNMESYYSGFSTLQERSFNPSQFKSQGQLQNIQKQSFDSTMNQYRRTPDIYSPPNSKQKYIEYDDVYQSETLQTFEQHSNCFRDKHSEKPRQMNEVSLN